MAGIRIEGLHQAYGSVIALRDIRLEVADGEFLSLLGPSGSGKTTLLRILAGFEPPVSGRIFFDEKEVTFFPPEKRQAGMVFQNYALFPHLSVGENIAYGLRAAGASRQTITDRIREMLELVDLPGFAERDVHTLSGGQQQRIALARALAHHPKVLLMDEPLSNLDARLRVQTRVQIRDLQQRLGMTTVYVTHDQGEAFSLSDRVAVLLKGAIRQVDTPLSIYRLPADLEVAEFLGEMNRCLAAIQPSTGGFMCISLDGAGITASLPMDQCTGNLDGNRVLVGIRPESFGPPGHFNLNGEGILEEANFEGERWRLMVRIGSQVLLQHWPSAWIDRMPARGEPFGFSMNSATWNLFPATENQPL